MSPKSSLELTEVQKKVIEELDVLTDAFVSTFKELGKVIKSYSEEISILTDSFTKRNISWRPQAQCWELLYFPFRDWSQIKRYKVESLGQIFCLTGRSTLEKKFQHKGKASLNYLSIEWGFKYDKEDNPFKFFYVEIEIDKTTDGNVLIEKEYENLSKRLKETIGIEEDEFSELDYSDEGGSERFYVWLDFKYSEKLSDFFQVCKDELITVFLSRIGDEKKSKR